MGMAASQGRLLQLTNRKNTISTELSRLSNEKISLTREMQKVSREYQDALNTTVLKWSSNSGVTYVDMTYSNLMTPSSMNQMEPYVITDINDRVVIASNYEEYAKMISPDGSAGGDWEKNRSAILSKLLGIDASAIEKYTSSADESAQVVGGADNARQIAFYDAIFTAIADKGWTQNNNVTDTTYLNAMFQNGYYTLTTMEKSLYTDGQNADKTTKFKYEYKTSIAENDTHVYKVKDDNTQEAIAQYEYKKSVINEKETRVDTRSKNLQTEQSAIQKMIEGLEQVKDDNIDRNFSIMS